MHLDGASNNHLQRQNAKTNMDEQIIKAIETVLSKGDRVELIPVKDGIKVIHIKRKEVKSEQ